MTPLRMFMLNLKDGVHSLHLKESLIHHPMIPPLATKSIMFLVFTGLAAISLMETENFSITSIIQVIFMILAYVSSIVAVAAVMRRDVKVLQRQMDEGVKWRESHDQLHSDTSAIMAKLTELSRQMEYRVQRLENNEDQNRNRRSTDGR